MKATMSRDNVKRVSFKINYRMDSRELAIYLVVALRGDFTDEDSFNLLLNSMGERKIMQKIQDTLYFNGVETPHYMISDNNLEKCVDIAQEKIESFFK